MVSFRFAAQAWRNPNVRASPSATWKRLSLLDRIPGHRSRPGRRFGGRTRGGQWPSQQPGWSCDIGIQIADNLYPVGNPAVDSSGNIYVTFSGSRGQKTPVSVYKIDLNYTSKPFVSEL